MWAQAAQPNQPTRTVQVPEATSSSPHPFINQYENASIEPQGTSREQLLLLQLEQAYAEIRIYDAKLKALEKAQEGAPVQERSRNDAEGDASVDDGRAPPPQAVRVNPDIRMFMTDTQGMRVEHPSDSTGASLMRPSGDVGLLVTNTSEAATAEWSHLNMIRAPTVPAEEKCDVLFQVVKNLQDAIKEKEQKLSQVRQMNSSMLTQLNASKLEGEVMMNTIAKLQQENDALKEEVKTQANTIQELRNLQNQRNRHLSSQAGVNRGRFILSRASMLECSKCNEVFPSSNAARDSNCSYHPKAACELSSKMVAEIFPEKGRQCYYWPCCGKIGTKAPPPCHHGTHTLRAN